MRLSSGAWIGAGGKRARAAFAPPPGIVFSLTRPHKKNKENVRNRQARNVPPGRSFAPMIIGLLRIDLYIPASHSLKEKRSVLQKTIHRLRTTYNVAVAEVDNQDKWARAELAVVTISTLRDRVEETHRLVLRDLDTAQDLRVLDSHVELL